MKKLISLLLAVIMAVMLVSCDSTKDQDDDPPKVKVELSRGTIDGDVYKNEYLDFEFTKPESWVYSTDEEIASLLNLSVDTILGDKFKDALNTNPSLYDMMVVDSLTSTNISVGYENLSKTFSSNITEKQYVESLKKQLENVSDMTVVFPDTLEKAMLGNTEFSKAVCTTTVYNTTMNQIYYLRKVDGYMAYVIVTIPNGYTIAQIEAMFK
ncbi:MAG: hypothetical protein IJF11_06545 [Clostridia bacterium]|nr:hypothetical protein [Clostridia bacterium]